MTVREKTLMNELNTKKRKNISLTVRLLLCVMFFALCPPVLHFSFPASGAEALPIVKVAISDDQSIIMQRIVYTALQRCGYQMVSKVTGMLTAVNDVTSANNDAAILPIQTLAYEAMYPDTLVRVPTSQPIDQVLFTAYAKEGHKYDFEKWEDMEGLRLGYRFENQYVANNIDRANPSVKVGKVYIEELWTALRNGEIDAVIVPRMSLFEFRAEGIKKAGVVDNQACYTYVNKRFAEANDGFVEDLSRAYEEMLAGGEDSIMEAIKRNQNPFATDRQTVLHINSYNAQNQYERGQMESLRSSLESHIDVDYRNIYLNANELLIRSSFYTIMSDMIRMEYVARYPSLIIASGNEALDFVLSNYYLLFPNVPVLFFGVQGFDPAILYDLEDLIVGIPEKAAFFDTVREMVRLYPDTKEIYILNDNYLTRSIEITKNVISTVAARKMPTGVSAVYNQPDSFDEILKTISGLAPNALVLIGNYLTDGKNIYSEAEVRRRVAEARALVNPVFCLISSYVGDGTFGGKVLSSDASMVAFAAANILTTTEGRALTRLYDNADEDWEEFYEWRFDYKTAAKFGINTDLLPNPHVPLNRTPTIWEANLLEVTLALAIGALFLMIIAGLIIFLRIVVQKQAEAKAASGAKSVFLAQMSHEIRTPLNAIVGMTSIGMSTEETQRMKYCFGKIEGASKHLLGVINDILDMSKIEANKLELSPVKFNFEKLLQSVVDVITFRAKEKKQKFSVNFEKDMPSSLIGDDQRLSQVITNLLSNAVKFTPEEGSIILDARLFPAPDAKNNDMCRLQISVSDTGLGISDEQKARLFRPFEQADKSTSRKFGGTGLGLAISKSIIEAMDGGIWVESQPGKGSTFTFNVLLKIDKEGAVAGAAKTEATSKNQFEDYSTRTILLAEDVEINREIVIALLESTNVKIECAENGAAAVKMYQAAPNKYDIIFMDLQMPEMDGYEATRQIRALSVPRAKKVPIVAMTANVFREDIEKCLAAGMNDHIGKPINPANLFEQMRKYLREK